MLPDSLLSNYISFDQSTLKLSYNGELIQGALTQRKFAKISITIVDSEGSKQAFQQNVIIQSPSEETDAASNVVTVENEGK